MRSADIVLTSLGSDEAVESVYAELFAGQEVSGLQWTRDREANHD
jgi:hypothetical protein